MTQADLHPPHTPIDGGALDVGDGHTLYWESCGRADGAPILFLHGGPGAGVSPAHRRFFDPAFYHLISFDQRGCGRSTPHASVEANTTPHLIADIEKLREHLKIDRWAVFGGSWGATLGLRYAQTHRDRVAALILRGVFLGRWREVEWFLDGIGRVFPEAAAAFRQALPEEERGDLLENYYRRLIDPDPTVHGPAAQAWARYEAACSCLFPPRDLSPVVEARAALAIARLESHYFVNRLFMEEGVVLKEAEALRGLPGAIVQGRYDMICPIESAMALAQLWPEARLTISPDSGHAAMEPGVRRGLVSAVEDLKRRWRGSWD